MEGTDINVNTQPCSQASIPAFVTGNKT